MTPQEIQEQIDFILEEDDYSSCVYVGDNFYIAHSYTSTGEVLDLFKKYTGGWVDYIGSYSTHQEIHEVIKSSKNKDSK